MSITSMIISGESDYKIRKKYYITPKGIEWIKNRVLDIMSLPEHQKRKELKYIDDIVESELTY